MAAHGVNFVDEDDARRIFLRVLEHVAHAGRTHTHKHFNEVRAGNRKERHFGLTRNRLGQQGFTRTRWADQQQTTRNTAAQLLELGGIFQEVDDFLDFFLGLITPRHIGKGHGVGVFIQQARLAFAKAECSAFAATLHLAHEVHPHADQQQHRPPADQQGHEQRAFFTRLDVELDAIGDQVAHQAPVEVGSRGTEFAVIRGGGDDFRTTRALLDGGDFDAVAAHFFEEVGVTNCGRAAAGTGVKLFEHREKHHGDHEPYGNF